MVRPWLAPLLALAACGELSGLDALEVDGAADVATTTDAGASEDAVTDQPPTSDVADQLDTPPNGYCQSFQKTPTFCADFDEATVTIAYAKGLLSTWTSASQQKPQQNKSNFVSAPASAGFSGGSGQTLRWDALLSATSELVFDAMIRDESVADSGNIVATIQLGPSYGLGLVLTRNAQTFQLTLNESVVTDAGAQITPHLGLETFSTGAWLPITINVTSSGVSATLGSSANVVTFQRATAGFSGASVTLSWGGAGWNGNWDNVSVDTN